MSNDNPAPPPIGALELRWNASTSCWYGSAGPLGGSADDAVGPAGPAGVVALREGDLCVSQCFITGRVEQLWVPADMDSVQRALLDLLLVDPPSPLRETPRGEASVSVVVRPATDRGELFLWTRLLDDVERQNLPKGGAAWVYLTMELAVTAVELHWMAPNWITLPQVAERLSDARRAIESDRALSPDIVDPSLQASIELELKGIAQRWRGVLAEFGADHLGDDLGIVTGFLSEKLTSTWKLDLVSPGDGNTYSARSAILGATAADVMLGALAQEHEFDEPIPGATLRAVTPGEALPAGADPTIDVDSIGQVVIPELTARRFDVATEPGRIVGNLESGWQEVRLVASAEAPVLASRWVVLYGQGRLCVGAGPLRCVREGGEKVLVGSVAVAGPVTGMEMTTHPARPVHPVEKEPSVDRAILEARAAVHREAAGGDASGVWAKAALDWLQLGTLYRAAWAMRSADQQRFAQGFMPGGESELAVALAALRAVLSTGDVPGPETGRFAQTTPAWWLIARGSGEAEDSRA